MLGRNAIGRDIRPIELEEIGKIARRFHIADQQACIPVWFRAGAGPILGSEQDLFPVHDNSLGMARPIEAYPCLVEAEFHRSSKNIALLAKAAAEDDPHVID